MVVKSEIKWRIDKVLPSQSGLPFVVYDVVGAYWSPKEQAWMSQGRLRFCGCRTFREARKILREMAQESTYEWTEA